MFFVYPGVLGEEVSCDGVMLDLLAGPQPQAHHEGSLHLTNVHLKKEEQIFRC